MIIDKTILKIAMVHLSSKKRQTIVAMLGVTFGITVFIFQGGLMSGFQGYFIEKTLNTSAHIRIFNDTQVKRAPIAAAVYGTDTRIEIRNQKLKEEDRRLKNGFQIMSRLQRHPEVSAIAPYLASPAIFKAGVAQVSGRIAGVDIIKENEIFKVGADVRTGDILKLETTPNGIVLGSGVAEKLGVAVNDNIIVISPIGNTLEMKVSAISQTGVVAVDDSRAYMNIRNAQKLLNVDGSYITDLNLKLKDINKAGELAAEFTKVFGYKAEDWKTANANIFGVFKIQNMVTYMVIVSILIVSGFGIFNILMMIIYEKMPDIAILKSIGYRNADIMKLFLTEALIIGFCGGLMGLVLGKIVTTIVSSIPMNIKGFVQMQYLMINSSPAFYALAFTFAIVATSIAGILPARKASKVDPIDIIRGK